MPGLRIIEATPAQWRVPDAVPAMLRPAGGLGQTAAGASGGAAGRDSPSCGRTWPGCDLGLRAPDPDEMPLTEAEVAFGIERGLIDPHPPADGQNMNHHPTPKNTQKDRKTPPQGQEIDVAIPK